MRTMKERVTWTDLGYYLNLEMGKSPASRRLVNADDLDAVSLLIRQMDLTLYLLLSLPELQDQRGQQKTDEFFLVLSELGPAAALSGP